MQENDSKKDTKKNKTLRIKLNQGHERLVL